MFEFPCALLWLVHRPPDEPCQERARIAADLLRLLRLDEPAPTSPLSAAFKLCLLYTSPSPRD
eukprot:7822350-Alexandrium_andersonii.AAC.1